MALAPPSPLLIFLPAVFIRTLSFSCDFPADPRTLLSRYRQHRGISLKVESSFYDLSKHSNKVL